MKQWKQVTAAVLAVSMGILLLGGCADNTPALYNDPVTREDDVVETGIDQTIDHRKVAFTPSRGGTYSKAELHVSFLRNGRVTDTKTVTLVNTDFFYYPILYVDAPEKWDDVTYEWVLEEADRDDFWTVNYFPNSEEVVDGQLVAEVLNITDSNGKRVEEIIFTAIFEKDGEFVDIQQAELEREDGKGNWLEYGEEGTVRFPLPEGGTEAYDKYYIRVLQAYVLEDEDDR